MPVLTPYLSFNSLERLARIRRRRERGFLLKWALRCFRLDFDLTMLSSLGTSF